MKKVLHNGCAFDGKELHTGEADVENDRITGLVAERNAPRDGQGHQ